MPASVSSVDEMHVGQDADVAAGGTTFRRVYRVKISEASSYGADLAVNASSVPAYGDAWPNVVSGRATPRVIRKRASLLADASRLYYRVEVDYSNNASALAALNESEEAAVAPWLRDPLYSYDVIERTEALRVDFNPTSPTVVANSAGDPFDPQPEIVVPNMRIVVRRATYGANAYNPAAAVLLWRKVNSLAFTVDGRTYAANDLLLTRWTGEDALWTDPATDIEQEYTEETIELEYHTGGNGHVLRLVDQGFRYLDSGDLRRFTDTDGEPSPVPAFLDGSGALDATPPTILTFYPYEAADFSALGSL